MHAKLIESLDPENRRVAAPISEDVFLMRNAQCPADQKRLTERPVSDEAETIDEAPSVSENGYERVSVQYLNRYEQKSMRIASGDGIFAC